MIAVGLAMANEEETRALRLKRVYPRQPEELVEPAMVIAGSGQCRGRWHR